MQTLALNKVAALNSSGLHICPLLRLGRNKLGNYHLKRFTGSSFLIFLKLLGNFNSSFLANFCTEENASTTKAFHSTDKSQSKLTIDQCLHWCNISIIAVKKKH
ncbi:hypothetical protein CEXT_397891 [Caerostris extrusa]|uniref:Uncharacterized protein n=1 Tax=Caerostris extrusa TaxID=172846 RepID=A0AAV4S8X2_CAEEX|nr:hypothetical protein CEXT_397891 [Caerostris extrusa]